MWIVKLALRRPYTFIVLALLLFLISPVMLLRTPVDIFPAINIPVISVIWTYTRLVPSEMSSRIVSIFERSLTTTVNGQNVILPSGTAKIGRTEYNVALNGTPSLVQSLNDLPVKVANGGTIYIRDVANVRDGYAVQTNIVRQDGQRGVLLTVQKSGNVSTLSIVSDIYKALPKIAATLPSKLVIKPLFDQSVFVRASLTGVVREAGIAALMTSLMILLFLGSWRSTLIITVSIPLSILTSLLILSALGETINIMTLGGLALAVGILVDDATVTIENIERQMAMKKELNQAILDGAEQIAVPALVSTLSISIVFVPMFFLTGVARYLFVPLAEAVVFALLASYFFSRTPIPTLVMYLMKKEAARYQHP